MIYRLQWLEWFEYHLALSVEFPVVAMRRLQDGEENETVIPAAEAGSRTEIQRQTSRT